MKTAIGSSITASLTLIGAGAALAQPPSNPPPEPTQENPCPATPEECPGQEGATTTTTSQTTTETVPPPPQEYNVNVEQETSGQPMYQEQYRPQQHQESIWRRIGFALTLGGGASGFASDTMRDLTDAGGDWTVRLTAGLRSPLAFEASYIGSAQGIDALGVSDDAVLLGNGAQGVVRLNALPFGMSPVSPFIYGGVAWRHFDIVNEDFNRSAISDSDNVLEVPAGLGLSTTMSGFIVDLRGEYRFSFFDSLAPSIDQRTGFVNLNDNADLARWGVNLTVGIAL